MFSYDSKFNQAINRILDCLFLCLLWIVSSLPLITVGAATTALYHTVDSVLRRGEGGIWKEYWRVFRRDFKRATGLWLIMLVVILILLANFFTAFTAGIENEMVVVALQIGAVFLTAIMAIWLQCWFPYLARFDDPVKIILKNTLAMMLVESKVAVRLLLLFVLVVGLDVVLSIHFPFFTVVLPVAYVGALNAILEKMFARYIAKQEESLHKTEEETANG